VRPPFASQRGQAAPLCAISATGAVSATASSGLKSVLANTGFGLKSGLVARGTPGLLKSVIGPTWTKPPKTGGPLAGVRPTCAG